MPISVIIENSQVDHHLLTGVVFRLEAAELSVGTVLAFDDNVDVIDGVETT